MVSSTTRNILGAVCTTCILCVVIMHATIRSSTTIVTSDTVMAITEDFTEKPSTPPTSNLKQVIKAAAIDTSKTHKANKTLQVIITRYDSRIPDSEKISLSSSTTTFRNEATLPDDEIFNENVEQTSSPDPSSVTGSYEKSTEPLPPINLTRFDMDFELSDDIGTVLQKRRNHVYETCAKFGKKIQRSVISSPAKYWKQLLKNPNVLTDHNQELTFCSVPKSGSTFWKSVFLYMRTGEVIKGMKAAKVLDDKSHRSIATWDDDKIDGELYTSFVAVRNPWKRLVSLYQQKIEKYLPKLRKQNFRLTKVAPFKYIKGVCRVDPQNLQTFADMIECVLKLNFKHSPNRHWTSAYEYCDICDMDFTYIIRTENMMNEGAYVMEQAGIKGADKILSTVRNGTIREVEMHKPKHYSEYFREIDAESIAELREMYKWETELFGYPDTPFTS